MNDLIKEKMEIAKRAGVLHEEIKKLDKLLNDARIKRDCRYEIRINVSNSSGLSDVLSTHTIDPNDFYLHDAIIEYLEVQIDKRHQELDNLIKILK